MTTRTITGLIRKPDGTPWAGGIIAFSPNAFAFTDEAVYPRSVVAETAADGTFSVTLAGDLPTTWAIKYPDDSTTYRAVITSGPPITLSELLAVDGIPAPMTSDVQVALDAGFAAQLAQIEALAAMMTEIDGGGPSSDYSFPAIDGGSV